MIALAAKKPDHVQLGIAPRRWAVRSGCRPCQAFRRYAWRGRGSWAGLGGGWPGGDGRAAWRDYKRHRRFDKKWPRGRFHSLRYGRFASGGNWRLGKRDLGRSSALQPRRWGIGAALGRDGFAVARVGGRVQFPLEENKGARRGLRATTIDGLRWLPLVGVNRLRYSNQKVLGAAARRLANPSIQAAGR